MHPNPPSANKKLHCLFRRIFCQGPRNRVKRGPITPLAPALLDPPTSHCPPDAKVSVARPGTNGEPSKAQVPAPLSSVRRSDPTSPLKKHVDMGSVGQDHGGFCTVPILEHVTKLLGRPGIQGVRDGMFATRLPENWPSQRQKSAKNQILSAGGHLSTGRRRYVRVHFADLRT